MLNGDHKKTRKDWSSVVEQSPDPREESPALSAERVYVFVDEHGRPVPTSRIPELSGMSRILVKDG
jgi:hypothetical protein